jgi:hypothetical protein
VIVPACAAGAIASVASRAATTVAERRADVVVDGVTVVLLGWLFPAGVAGVLGAASQAPAKDRSGIGTCR